MMHDVLRSALLVFALLAVAAPASASVVRPERDAVLRVTGLNGGSWSPSLAAAGDVNGDGRPDLLIGQDGTDAGPTASALVVFGRADRAAIDARAPLGEAGFTIAEPENQVPTPGGVGAFEIDPDAGVIGSAGDVNGDGLADVLVAYPAVGNSLRRASGSVYVVFGKRDSAPVRLSALGDGGFRIDGVRAFAHLGAGLVPLGDVDGDGLGDLAIGGESAAYVVRGSRSPATVDLRRPSGRAQAFLSPIRSLDMENWHTVAPAGDVDGDGRGDFALGLDSFVDDDRIRQAHVWVVFGRPGTAPVDLRKPGGWGFEVLGTKLDGIEISSVAPAGDVNRDGRGDLVLSNGAYAYVVPGQATTTPVDVRTDRRVLTIRGTRGQGGDPVPVAGDGRGAVALVDSGGGGPCGDERGGGTISVLQPGPPGRLDLRRLGSEGFRLQGEGSGLLLDGPVALLGDVDGDGRGDMAVELIPYPRPDVEREVRSREVAVIPVAPTAEDRDVRSAACVRIRALTRTAGEAARARRVRIAVSVLPFGPARRPGTVTLDYVVCAGTRCVLEPVPGVRSRTPVGRVGSTVRMALPLRPAALRRLRDPAVRALTVCVGEERCVDLPNRR